MSEYVRKDGITDIENSGSKHGLIRQEEAGIGLWLKLEKLASWS